MSWEIGYQMMVSAPLGDLKRFIDNPKRFEPPGAYDKELVRWITEDHTIDYTGGSAGTGRSVAGRPLDDCHCFFYWWVRKASVQDGWLEALSAANPTLTIALREVLTLDYLSIGLAFVIEGEVDWLGYFDKTNIDAFLKGLADPRDWLRAACVEAVWHVPATWCHDCLGFVTGAAWVGRDAIKSAHRSGAHHRNSSGLLVSTPVLGLTP